MVRTQKSRGQFLSSTVKAMASAAALARSNRPQAQRIKRTRHVGCKVFAQLPKSA